MATFEDASRWVRVQFFLTVLGFGLFTAGLTTGQDEHLGSDLRIAFTVLSFLCYLLALTLSFAWTFVDEARNNKGVYVSFIVFGFLAAIFTIVKVTQDVKYEFSHPCIILYSGATFFVLLAAIFTLVEVAGDVNVKLPTLPSPRKAKKEKDVEAGEEEGEKKEEVVELEDKPKGDEEKVEGETKESEDKTEEGATNGHVVKEEEEKKEEKEEEKKEEGEEKKEESAAKE